MGLSTGFGSSQKMEAGGAVPPGPPFDLDSAENGASVDGSSFKIVLGNDVGGTAARLLSNREIDMDGNFFQFIDTTTPDFSMKFDLMGLTIEDTGNTQTLELLPGGVLVNDGSAEAIYQGNLLSITELASTSFVQLDFSSFTMADNVNAITTNIVPGQMTMFDSTLSASLTLAGMQLVFDTTGGGSFEFAKEVFIDNTSGGLHIRETGGGGTDIASISFMNDVSNTARIYFTSDGFAAPFPGGDALAIESVNGISLYTSTGDIGFYEGATNNQIARFALAGLYVQDTLNILIGTMLMKQGLGNGLGISAGGATVVTVGPTGTEAFMDVSDAGSFGMSFTVGGGTTTLSRFRRIGGNATLSLPLIPTFTTNALALAGGLVAGDLYTPGAGVLSVVF